MNSYNDRLEAYLANTLIETNFPFGKKRQGKVRDSYELPDKMVFITTDRQTAFDRMLAVIPCKGQVLNQVSAWWFERTKDIVPNHVLSVPDPNVTIVEKCAVLPIEVVVRAYLTGTTETSAWVHYARGERVFCGNKLPDGMRKNEPFARPILTPSTKLEEHDRSLSPQEILEEGLVTQTEWDQVSAYALALFAYGQKVAAEHGLILVDTKYEFGRDAAGTIRIIDETHTPDSSRYWIAKTYPERFAAGQEPENIDKEFLRLWFAEHCDPYNDPELPPAPEELVLELANRYIGLYEMITGQTFQFPDPNVPVTVRIAKVFESIQ